MKTKSNPTVLAVASALLFPPAWIVFQGVRRLAAVPTPVAAFTIGAMVAASVTLVFLALQNLKAGDVRDAWVQLGGAAVILVAEFVGQWWFALAEHHALVTALIFSVLSVAGGTILEGEILRVWKANARKDGTISLPRAQVPREVARAYPAVSARATKLAIRYPNATQESILSIAFAEQDQADAAAAIAKAQVRVDVRDLINPPAALESGSSADSSGSNPGGSGELVGDSDQSGGFSGSASSLVKAMIKGGVTDPDVLLSGVMDILPGSNPETVKRYIRAQSKNTA